MDVGIGLAVGLAASWVLLLVAVLGADRRGGRPGELVWLLPRTMRLLVSLARDRSLPRGLRWRLAAAVAYAGQPFNLIPDWIPVVGYADNVAAICWALRSAIRTAGPQAVAAHWTGGDESLARLYKALRLDMPGVPTGDPSDRLSAG